MFAHKIVKTAVNSWAGKDSGAENYRRVWGGQDPQLQLSDIQGSGKNMSCKQLLEDTGR